MYILCSKWNQNEWFRFLNVIFAIWKSIQTNRISVGIWNCTKQKLSASAVWFVRSHTRTNQIFSSIGWTNTNCGWKNIVSVNRNLTNHLVHLVHQEVRSNKHSFQCIYRQSKCWKYRQLQSIGHIKCMCNLSKQNHCVMYFIILTAFRFHKYQSVSLT